MLESSAFFFSASHFKFPTSFKYFTNWGQTLTEIYFCMVMLAYAVERCDRGKQDVDHHATCKMWKVVTYLFQTALMWEVIITIVFWAILWPTETHITHGWCYDFRHTALVHLLPLIYLLVDFVLNRIYFEWH